MINRYDFAQDLGATSGPTTQAQYIEFQADTPLPDGVVAETRSDDNAVRLYLPDISLAAGTSSVGISPPNNFVAGSPAAGSTATLLLSYSVNGRMAYPDFSVYYRLQQNKTAAVWSYGNAFSCTATVAVPNNNITVFPGGGVPPAEGKVEVGTLATGVLFPRCVNPATGRDVEYDVTVCVWLDNGHCIAERDETNNTLYKGNAARDCQNIHVHTPQPDVTAWRYDAANPMDITLGDVTDVTQPVNGVSLPVVAIIKNNGEAPTSGRVWVQLWAGNDLKDTKMTTGILSSEGNVNDHEVLSFDWIPKSSDQQIEIRVDPSFFACPLSTGCEQEYNETNNNTKRDLPELEAVDIKAKE